MKENVSTIIFDLGGVILNLDYSLTTEAFKAFGSANFEALYAQAQQNHIFDQFEIGAISSQEFRAYLRSAFGQHLTDNDLDTAWNAMLLDLPLERVELLQKLRADYRVLLYSNTNAIHLKKFQEIIEDSYGTKFLLEDLFHETYYSHLISRRKPHAESFQYILEINHLTPEEVVFIDDSIQHVEGAASIGIRAHHLINQDIISLCKSLF